MQKYVIYDKHTKEVIAYISEDAESCILRQDADIKVYNDTEPVFITDGDYVMLADNAFIITLHSNQC